MKYRIFIIPVFAGITDLDEATSPTSSQAPRMCIHHEYAKLLTNMDPTNLSEVSTDLEREISILEKARRGSQEGAEENLVSLEKELSLAFVRKFQQSQSLEDIRMAQNHAKAALEHHQSEDDGEKQGLLLNIANSLFLDYRISGDRSLLDEAIATFTDAVQLPFKEASQKVSLLENFWLVLKARIAREPTMEDVQKGIDALQEALREVLDTRDPGSHFDPDIIRDLLSLYLIKFDFIDDYPDLDHAIIAARLAIRIASVHDPHNEREKYQHNLATFLDKRFARDRNADDLEGSLSIWSVLVESAKRGGNTTKLGIRLNGLSIALRSKYLLTRQVDCLQESIRVAREAFNIADGTGNDEAKQATGVNLSIALAARFEELGTPDDLDEAIRLCDRVAKQTTSDRDRAKYLNNLATYYSSRYTVKGDVADLDKTIEIGRRLVKETAHGDYRANVFMGNLSSWLQDIYDATGALTYLEEAIAYARQSISDDIRSHEDRLILRSNLCERLSRWYDRTKQLPALDEAIRLMWEVVNDSGERHPMRPVYKNNLGNYLATRFNKKLELQDIEKAISLAKSAVDETSESNLYHANYWNSLGHHYHDKFTKTASRDDLDSSIYAIRRAASLAQPDQPHACIIFSNMGAVLLERASKFGTEQDRIEGKEYLLQAANHQTGRLITRITASAVAGLECAKDGDLFLALEVLQGGVALLSRISPRSISREDQQHNLSGVSGVSSIACSVALAAKRTPSESLDLLECGRAIISGLSLRINSDLVKLESSRPWLCSHYKDIRDRALDASQASATNSLRQLENPSSLMTKRIDYDAKRQTLKLLEELDIVEQRIRSIPGFRNFQRSPSGEQCMQMASEGPIVYFNVTELRSDVILITSSSISSMSLPDLKHSDLTSNVKLLLGRNRVTSSSYLGSKAERNKLLLPLLQWLWNVAVKPVLGKLGLLVPRKPGRPTPRVCWVASGVMGIMPFHAAGTHTANSTENTISCVASTYITTLKAFAQALEAVKTQPKRDADRALIVAMPTTPGKKPIAAMEEAACLTIVHFACHGISSLANPSEGGLLLGQEGDEAAQHLNIAELSTMRLGNGHLVYLSACSTAENLAEDLMDEVIHTASGFQLLGFPHVIGTLWEAGNKEAVQVAEVFYDHWLGAAPSAVAYSLHEAVLKLRDGGVPGIRRTADPRQNVLSWAPFIHIGV
jgi:tetratricopeptide (TPR) repeat protein